MHKTNRTYIFCLILLTGALLTFSTYSLFSSQADTDAWTKEQRVMEKLSKSLGLTLRADDKPALSEDLRVPHFFVAGYGGPIQVQLNQNSNRESLQTRLENLRTVNARDRKFWEKESLKGKPSMSYMGSAVQDKVVIGRSIIRILFYPYLLEVNVHLESTKKGDRWYGRPWTENRARAEEIVDQVLSYMKAEGLVAAGPDSDATNPASGSVTIEMNAPNIGVISGLRCIFQSSNNTKPIEVVTDSFGRAKFGIQVRDRKSGLKVKLSTMEITPETRYGVRPSYVYNRVTVIGNQEVQLTEKNQFMGVLRLKLAVRPVYVTARRGDVVGAPGFTPGVAIRRGNVTGEIMFKLPPADLTRFAIYIPIIRSLTGAAATFHATAMVGGQAYAGWEMINLPTSDMTSQAVIIDLYPDTVAGQFDRFRPRLSTFLENSGYSQEQIRTILAVRFATSARGGSRYYPGLIEVNEGAKFSGYSDDVMHELGHHIAWVVNRDNPPGVGVRREGRGPTNPNAAWDEGRADFYSYVLTRELGLPPATAFTESPSGVTDTVRREDFVQEALVEHYSNRAIFPTLANAMADLRLTSERAQQTLGRPPRTIVEFLNVKANSPNSTPAEIQDAQRIRARYGFQ